MFSIRPFSRRFQAAVLTKKLARDKLVVVLPCCARKKKLSLSSLQLRCEINKQQIPFFFILSLILNWNILWEKHLRSFSHKKTKYQCSSVLSAIQWKLQECGVYAKILQHQELVVYSDLSLSVTFTRGQCY